MESVKIEKQVTTYASCEVHGVIRFLHTLGQTNTEIHEELISVYSEKCMSLVMVGKWVKQFDAGRTDVHDLERSEHPSDSMTFENIQSVPDLLEEDRNRTICELCLHLQSSECGSNSLHKIVHDILHFWKLTSRWVPRLLTDGHKTARRGAALSLLTAYHREGPSLINRIVTGDETYIHHHTPESKQQGMAWCAEGETPPKKAKQVRSAGKILATVFLVAEGILHVQYHPKGKTVTRHTYEETLKKLHQAIRRKLPNLRGGDIHFIQDNARPHMTAEIWELLSCFSWENFHTSGLFYRSGTKRLLPFIGTEEIFGWKAVYI